jgi:hypothetical protein
MIDKVKKGTFSERWKDRRQRTSAKELLWGENKFEVLVCYSRHPCGNFPALLVELNL